VTGTAVTGTAAAGVDERFAASRALFETTLGFLDGAQAAGLEHAELESHRGIRGGLRVAAARRTRRRSGRRRAELQEVTDAGQVARGAVEAGHTAR
jgi:hypothetical protein